MTVEAWITLGVVLVMLVALVCEWTAPAIAVLGAMALLLVVGVTTPEEALAGFSNAAPITVAALYVLARAVEKTGALQPLLSRTLARGSGPRRSLARILLPTAGASAILNNTPIVAMLAPQVAGWAEQRGHAASFYLMPISFAAILGGMVTLIGTSTNLVVSGLLQEVGQAPLGMFEMTGVGLPVALVGLVLIVALAPVLLPERRGPLRSFEEESKEFTVGMEVDLGGPADGRSIEDAGLRHLEGVYLAGIEREGELVAPVGPEEVLRGGDYLVFVGSADLVVDLQAVRGLRSAEHEHTKGFEDDAPAFFEVVVSPISPLVGATLRDANFREQYQAAVMAIHRSGERVRGKLGEVRLRPGDALLLLSHRGFRSQWRDRRDFLLIADLAGSLPIGTRKGAFVLATAGAMVGLAALGWLPILKGALLAAILMVVTGTLSASEAVRAVDMNVILLIAAAFGVGAAIQVSGLATVLAGGIVGPVAALGPVAVLAGVVLATFLLTELITNNAAAVLMFPVGVAAAAAVGVDPRGFAWAVALAASASFLSPVGYQTNTMVYGLGGYHFGDYARLGLPIAAGSATLIVGAVAWQWGLW